MPRVLLALIALLIVSGCRDQSPEPDPDGQNVAEQAIPATATPTATFTPTPTPTSTSTPTFTPTPTNTPTPTFTPTPTAIPLQVSGDPRAAVLTTPSYQGNAPCGIVDVLDFPINPPDASNVARGGQDFGVFRSRYDGFHTGEDWWSSRGHSSFGAPVFSIGHGLVTFAQPLGWGRDQGVIIIQHTLSDGGKILSFYGHLDPESFAIRSGECAERGELLAKIGRPTSTPHLHFEIRHHNPYETMGGYWSLDPTTAGWEPPSQYIWNQRIASSPGVLWARPPVAADSEGIGIFGNRILVGVEQDRLTGIDVTDGRLLWNHAELDRIDDAVLDSQAPVVYTTNQFGQIHAYEFADPNNEDGLSGEVSDEPLWTMDHDIVGFPTLMPLPGGGVALFTRDRLIGVTSEGRLAWELEPITRPVDWIETDEGLLFTTSGRERTVWVIDGSSPEPWNETLTGHLASDGEMAYLYGEDGIRLLDVAARETELLYELSSGILGMGDIVVLPDGAVLVAHADQRDRRLILLDSDGSLLWERSYANRVDGAVELVTLDGQPYLIANDTEGATSTISVFHVDAQSAELTRIFTGGTRSSGQHPSTAYTAGDGLIVIDIGGGSLAALDVHQAREQMASTNVAP
ncbi:MAG TPA: peptidoglycan DD-metalloendopeptidase family protein [candidate division Zixibacteria bacterium]|nr:peptidoglycan DD-metalloendopeptidase family protein [candidate division Zixibacteria bacterium]